MASSGQATREWVLWIVAVSCGLHATEEYFTGWQAWARGALGIALPTTWFVVMNTVLVIAALVFAHVGWRRSAASLVIPSATLVNAIAFHIVPTITAKHVAPGLYTAVGLYLPFSTLSLIGAARDGVSRRAIAAAFVAGCAVALGVVVGVRLLGGVPSAIS